MTKEQLTQLLQSEIPLCQFMQLTVSDLAAQNIRTHAPLQPNRNMHQTGFAGSLYALAVATGWALVHFKMTSDRAEGLLVVKKATIHYKRPVTSDIELHAELSDQQASDSVKAQLEVEGKAEFPLKIWIESAGRKCGYLEAEYTVVI